MGTCEREREREREAGIMAVVGVELRGVRARGGRRGARKGIERKLVVVRGNERKREHVVCGAQISSNDLKNGVSLELDGTPFKVVEFMHVKPGKGAAFVRSKLKNAITGNVIDKVRDDTQFQKRIRL